ncbi:hypothetical protein [Paracoccus sp. (in: a-proteobacteria)]|uniref:hypothetical protein n=1 Tax=Paracoccus sp. TaxID=267 RepID=UPI00396C8FCE
MIFHAPDLGTPFESYDNDLLEQGLQQHLDKLRASMTLTGQVLWLLRRYVPVGQPDLHSRAQEQQSASARCSVALPNRAAPFRRCCRRCVMN